MLVSFQAIEETILLNLSYSQMKQGKLIAEIPALGMQVRDQSGIRWLISSNGLVHGGMSLSDTSYPIMPYVRAMFLPFVFVENAHNLLNLGLGTGSIERYVASLNTDSLLTSVELCKDLVELSKQVFHVDKTANVVVNDALDYLETETHQFDIIFCDLFDNTAAFNHLYKPCFFSQLYMKLADGGMAAVNFLLTDQDELVRTLLDIRKVFPAVGIVDVDEQDNIVMILVKGPSPDEPGVLLNEKLGMQLQALNLYDVLDDLQWLPKVT